MEKLFYTFLAFFNEMFAHVQTFVNNSLVRCKQALNNQEPDAVKVTQQPFPRLPNDISLPSGHHSSSTLKHQACGAANVIAEFCGVKIKENIKY